MRVAFLLGLSLALCGCGPADRDGDGYTTEDDCDDADPSVHPGAPERCDERDQDCDGGIDEVAIDATAFYSDNDGDGYGLGSPFFACAPPTDRWSAVRGDCNDRDPAISPEAVETCDQRDENCDGEVDEGFVCGEIQCDDGIDDDQDGAIDCEDPDCDGACLETCEDGRDNDGDGLTDCADSDCWYARRCVETTCGDGVDDELDGLTDCQDPDCWSDPRCPAAAWRITAGSLAVNRETTSWTERDCDEPDCDSGVGLIQDIQAYDVRGELVRVVDGELRTCAFAYDYGRLFSRIESGSYADEQIFRSGFTIEPGCGPSDDRFLPHRLVRSEDGMRTPAGSLWFTGDRFEDSRRESDLEDPQRSGKIVRDLAFWDPLRPAAPLGRCAVGPVRVYFDDEDGDGVGAQGVGRMACAAEDTPTTGEDCDDANDAVPGPVEVCGNGIDDDCDGTAPACDGPGGVASLGEADGAWDGDDEVGILRVFDVGDLDEDGLADLVIGVPGEDLAGENAGGVRLWTSGLAFEDLDEALFLPGVAADDLAGAAVVNIGDHSGDGLDDLLITAPGVTTDGEARSGAAYILAAPFDEARIDAPHARITGPGLWLGTTAARLSDPADGGTHAFAIGCQTDPAGGTNAGSIRIFEGPVVGSVDPDEAASVIVGARNDILGDAIAGPGDVDGDGVADLLIGHRKSDGGATEAGAAHLWLGPFPALADIDEADVSWLGHAQDAWAGEKVAAAGDIDDDGYRDLLVSAPRIGGVAPRRGASTGEVYLIGGGAILEGADLRDATAVIRGDRILDVAGVSLAGARDLDGDGVHDFAIGAPGEDRGGRQAGVIAVFTEPLTGTFRMADASAHYRGEAGNQVGLWLALPGDLDGDGLSDLVTSGLIPDGGSSGRVFAVLGGEGW